MVGIPRGSDIMFILGSRAVSRPTKNQLWCNLLGYGQHVFAVVVVMWSG